MQLTLDLQVLLLVIVANGAPLVAKAMLGEKLAIPLDAGHIFSDGRRLFGSSKTVRGLIAGVGGAALCAPLLGFDWTIGLLIGAAALAGDLVSSFIKRRMDLPPGSQILGLDHIPESLVPALIAMPLVGLTLFDVAVVTALFAAGGLVSSLVLAKLRAHKQPN